MPKWRSKTITNPKAPPPSTTAPGRSVADRWTQDLAKGGHVPIVRSFLRNYSNPKLPYRLTHGEAMLVIHLYDFKWDTKAPFPGYKTLAEYMDISVKQARRLAKSLEDKGYLKREIRENKTNLFHLEPLLAVFERLIASGDGRGKKRKGLKQTP